MPVTLILQLFLHLCPHIQTRVDMSSSLGGGVLGALVHTLYKQIVYLGCSFLNCSVIYAFCKNFPYQSPNLNACLLFRFLLVLRLAPSTWRLSPREGTDLLNSLCSNTAIISLSQGLLPQPQQASFGAKQLVKQNDTGLWCQLYWLRHLLSVLHKGHSVKPLRTSVCYMANKDSQRGSNKMGRECPAQCMVARRFCGHSTGKSVAVRSLERTSPA